MVAYVDHRVVILATAPDPGNWLTWQGLVDEKWEISHDHGITWQPCWKEEEE